MATQEVQSMISETSICNQALSWLGQEEITSLEDPTQTGEWCRNNYAFLRDAVLEEAKWTFALERNVSTVGDRDVFNQKYTHNLPLDWLAVWEVWTDVSSIHERDWIPAENWQREGRFVLAEDETVYMRGTVRVTDTGFFSNMFVQALAARIAADLAIPVTGNKQLQADMWALYAEKLTQASNRDALQGTREMIRTGSLIKARKR